MSAPTWRVAIVAAVFAAACNGSDSTTGIAASDPITHPIQASPAARAAIDDAVTRLTPMLGVSSDASDVRTAMMRLQKALADGDPSTPSLAAAAETAVERYERGMSESAETEAIRLAIEVVSHPERSEGSR